MARLEGWPEILAAEIARARSRRFEWGAHDCASWALAVVAALTGSDPGASYRGTYDSEFGAQRILAAHGGLEALADELLPVRRPGVLYAQRGDVVLADLLLGPTLGVCVGAGAEFAGPDGLVCVPLKGCRCAWAV